MARQFNDIRLPDRLHLAKPPGSGLKRSWKTLWLWKISDGTDWELTQDFSVEWTDEGGMRRRYVARAGLITDMSSIPWFFQGLPGMQKAGEKIFGSIIHDDIYENHPPGWKRADADLLMHKIHLFSGVAWPIARAVYRAVRIGGQEAWET